MTSALLDRGRVEIKLAEYGVAPATALADSLLLGRTQDYRRAAASRLYPLEGSAINEKVPSAEFHVSRKIDGEFTVLVFRQGEVFTINPGGTVRIGLPVLEEAARLLSRAGVKEVMLACELYVARNDRRSRVHDIVSIASRPTAIAELDQIHLAAFDVISLNSASPSLIFSETWQQLVKLLASGTRIHPVEARWVSKPSAIRELYEQWVEKEGAEGIVCRS